MSVQGHAIATTETVTVTISQGPITYTWSNYKFSQFSDWVIKFKVRLCIWRYDPPQAPLDSTLSVTSSLASHFTAEHILLLVCTTILLCYTTVLFV